MGTEQVTIGNTTLYCGDCFSVLPKLGMEADAIITDPPFNCTNCKWDVPLPLDKFWTLMESQTKLSANYCLFATMRFAVDLINSRRKWFRYDLVWQKSKKCGFLNTGLMPMRNHESILVFGRPGFKTGATYNPIKSVGGRAGVRKTKRRGGVYRSVDGIEKYYDGKQHPCSVLPFRSEKDKGLHPTLKPIGLMEWIVRTYTDENDVVLDCFMGSGSTGVACVKAGRRFVGIEQDKKYFDIACKRIEKAHVELGISGEVNYE